MVYTLTFSPYYLHKGDSRGIVNVVSVTWLVLWACFWPAQISSSVWIFESAFRNQLQVFLHVLFRVFLIKLTMQLSFFPSNCRVSAHCSKMSSINWTDSFLTFNIPYPLPLAVKRPTNSSRTTPNCLTHLSHTPHSLWVPDLHPPLIHTTYQPLFLNGKHHSLSTPFLSLNPMFSVLSLPILAAPYLISTDTAQVFKNCYNLILSIQCWF